MAVDRLHEQVPDLRHCEGLFRKGIELGFGQCLCQRCDTLHSGPTGDEPVRPFLTLALFIVGFPVVQPLELAALLRQLLFVGGVLLFQFFNGFLFQVIGLLKLW